MRLLVMLWLTVLSFSFALAVNVALFDRTTLSGASRLWLGSLVFWFAATLIWWTRPRGVQGRLHFNTYELTSLLCVTLPMALVSIGLVVASYVSEQLHGYLYSTLYYARLWSDRSWPVMLLAAVLIGYSVAWTGRGFLSKRGEAVPFRTALVSTLSGLPSLLPVAVTAIGLVLASVSLSMINVNFWRYWATSDGWVVTAHYPSTFTDSVQVAMGGGSKYFVSYPLLPSLLTLSYGFLGHTTLASYLPIIAGNTLLPLAVFALLREMTGRDLLAFLFAVLAASFPLLRSYTMDVGEADGLLMTVLVLAAYSGLRASRDDRLSVQVVSAVVAGVAALARPEGVFYMAAMYMVAAVVRWRQRRYWASLLLTSLIIVGFSGILFQEYGTIWPDNYRFSATISLSNFFETLQVVQQSGLVRMWAAALSISPWSLVLAVLVMASVLALGSVSMLKRDSTLIWMPAAALGNVVMALAVGPVPAEATKYHDFFRHISYGFPLLAVTVAYGVNYLCVRCRHSWVRAVVYGAIALLVLGQLSLLEGPVTPGNPATTPLMTSDVHVMATELLIDPYPLPVMEFRRSDSRYVPDAAEYMARFPDNVNQHYAGADIRRVGNALDYYRAAMMLFIWFLALGALPFLFSVRRRRLSAPQDLAATVESAGD